MKNKIYVGITVAVMFMLVSAVSVSANVSWKDIVFGKVADRMYSDLISGDEDQLGAASGYAHYQHESFLQGLSSGGRDQFSISNVGAVTSSGAVSLTGVLTVTGETSVQGFTQGGGVLATTTTLEATATLTEAQLLANNIINYSDGGGVAPALTVTLPATSTMTTLMPNAGDRRVWVLENDFTGAATTTTIAAGTGIDLQEPGTGNVLNVIIDPAGKAYIDCYRRTDTDVVCLVMESSVAD